MTVQTQNLIQVKTIQAKHAKQIKVLEYDWNEGSMFKTIWKEFNRQMEAGTSQGGDGRPHGWIMQETIDPNASSLRKLWLVSYKGELYWWSPPADGSPLQKFFSDSGINQLFV